MGQQSPSPLDIDSFAIQTPDFDPQINGPHGTNVRARRKNIQELGRGLWMDLMPLLPNDKPAFPSRRSDTSYLYTKLAPLQL